VITDLCVVDIADSGFEVVELAEGVTREQIKERTQGSLRFSDALTRA
jgi:acyl CoA:acetate/3-ketoacid CoA transferase beta subunit